MGVYEIIVKTEEMRRKAQGGDYINAQRILDTIDLKKVKNISDLSLIAEVYTKNARYEEALEILLVIYNRTKTRKAVFQLVSNAIDRDSIEDAEDYLKEYERLAPRDFYLYIFRYQIDKLKGEPFDVLIETLKALKHKEFIEEWGYELAKLYYKAGMEEECIRECSDIILWFGEGVYVEKAKILRAYYSGEADKDKIIAELKKRAMRVKNATENEETTIPDKTTPEEMENVEDVSGEDYSVAMGKEVEEILAQEAEETYTYTTVDRKDNSFQTQSDSLSEKERIEWEVENKLYSLLKEEDDLKK